MPRKVKQLDRISRKYGTKAKLDSPGLMDELVQLALSMGCFSQFTLIMPSDDPSPLAEMDTQAEKIGLNDLAVQRRFETERTDGCLYTYLVSLFTETRHDELITLVSHFGDKYSVIPTHGIDSFFDTSRWGWLVETSTDGYGSEVLRKLAEKEDVAAGHAVAVARRLLRPVARQSRSLLKEELRQIERLYSDMSDESLEPIRRMQMRVSTGYGRIDGPTNDVRRLKGRVSAEERRYLEEKQAFKVEMAKRMDEAKAKYRSYYEIRLVQAAAIHYDMPVIRLPKVGTLKYNPFTQRPLVFISECDGVVIEITNESLLHDCGEGHIIDRSASPVCSCGNPVCLICSPEDAARCFYCGRHICQSCMSKVYNRLERSVINICPECNSLGYDNIDAFIDLL